MLPARIRRRVDKAIRQHGLAGTLLRLPIWPLLYLGWRLRERRPFERERAAAGEEYDRRHGVDTARTRSTEFAADVDSENWAAGTGYAATPPDTVRRAIGMLPIEHEEYAFVDLGSGKGRVVLVASEFPFRECVGVEYAPDLHAVAERNGTTFRSDLRRCDTIRFVCHDGATFPMPASPFVLFFAHPFGDAVLDAFLENLRRSLREEPRKAYVIYYDPICRERFLACGFREIGGHDLPRFHSFRNRLGKEFVVLEHDDDTRP